MFSVIFEVHPKPEKFDLYLELAKGLRPILEDRRLHRQRTLRERAPAGLDPVALDLA
jgi:hypothetical protein